MEGPASQVWNEAMPEWAAELIRGLRRMDNRLQEVEQLVIAQHSHQQDSHSQLAQLVAERLREAESRVEQHAQQQRQLAELLIDLTPPVPGGSSPPRGAPLRGAAWPPAFAPAQLSPGRNSSSPPPQQRQAPWASLLGQHSPPQPRPPQPAAAPPLSPAGSPCGAQPHTGPPAAPGAARFCSVCGAAAPASAHFCGACGAPLRRDAAGGGPHHEPARAAPPPRSQPRAASPAQTQPP
eukprot:TRINITY_DN23325_c0_g1_i1.p1 TRINITY_DN23325_c0_g1~~TRINITY_DN23325_c0_g1_i1.p1  ORF type:complete len:263 (+),score=45.76 TRINITY_DN23325_c0_g1_i1:80-790(+)